MNKLSLLAAICFIALGSPALAQGHGGSISVGGFIPSAGGVAPVQTQTVLPMQAAVSGPIPAVVTTTVLPTHPGFFPKDFIDPIYRTQMRDKREFNSKGIKEVPHIAMSNSGARGANFHAAEGSQWTQLSANEGRLNEGAVLLSLKGPAARVETANGTVTVRGAGNVLTSYVAGVMRVENISARGVACKVELNGKAIEAEGKTLALAPGYELVVGDRALAHGEIRPADGIARRSQFVFDGNHIAVNEFSVDSVLDSHPIVAAMRQDTTKQDGKTLDQMCKMAAVMNWVHGAGGYKPAEGTGIAGVPGRETK